MPFNVAAGNSSGYNYASGRLDHQTYYKAIRVDQDHLGPVVLDRVLRAWLDEAILISELLPLWMRTAAFRDLPHQWFWDGQEHVDPAKEANPDPTDAGVSVLNNAGSGESGPYQFAGRSGEIGLACREQFGTNYRIVTLSPNDFDPATFDVVTRVTATAYYTRQLRVPKGCTWGSEVEHLI